MGKGDKGKRRTIISLLLIAATALLIYSNIFSSPFLFDDGPNIVDNDEIRSLSNFWPPSGTRYAGYLEIVDSR